MMLKSLSRQMKLLRIFRYFQNITSTGDENNLFMSDYLVNQLN